MKKIFLLLGYMMFEEEVEVQLLPFSTGSSVIALFNSSLWLGFGLGLRLGLGLR